MATLNGSRAIPKVRAIKDYEFLYDRSPRKLMPAEVDMIPSLGDQQSVPKVDFFIIASLDRAFDNLGRREVVLNYP